MGKHLAQVSPEVVTNLQGKSCITLTRTYLMSGTLSTIDFGGGFILYGIERTRTDASHPCIPETEYSLEPHHGPKSENGPIWAMVNESVGVYHEPHGTDRFACLFGHVGNYPEDVEGCVAFGLKQNMAPTMVQNSKVAVSAFQTWMTNNWQPGINLIIKELVK